MSFSDSMRSRILELSRRKGTKAPGSSAAGARSKGLAEEEESEEEAQAEGRHDVVRVREKTERYEVGGSVAELGARGGLARRRLPVLAVRPTNTGDESLALARSLSRQRRGVFTVLWARL